MSDDLDMRAAEYVLGTLDADERSAFLREIIADPAARAAVADWERRLAPLARLSAPVTPSPGLWAADRAGHAICRPTGSRRRRNVVAFPRVAKDWRRAAQNWRRAAIVSGALAAGLALFIADHELRPRRAGGRVFRCGQSRRRQPALIVRVDLATQTVYVRPISAETPEGKSLELWMIPPGEKPKSMGVLTTTSERLPAPKGVPSKKRHSR